MRLAKARREEPALPKQAGREISGSEYLRQNAEKLAEWISARMNKRVTATMLNVIADGMEEGSSIRQMQEALRAQEGVVLGPDELDEPGEMIVRTAVIKSSNLARIEGLRELGIIEVELVGCDPDCKECQDVIAGNPYDLDRAAQLEMDLHPNHTGSWVPVFKPEDLKLTL